jgi:protein tyrosine/serine phosphatase
VDPALRGLVNLRDVGGLPTVDGSVTRPGRLFRSEALVELEREDARWLIHEAGLGAVVDLRSASETISEGRGVLTEFPLLYVNVPIDPASVTLVREPEAQGGDLTASVYIGLLEHPHGMLAHAVKVLGTLLDQPTLVHCAAGKDRTGIVIALALSIAGVEREAIVADYLRSEANNELVNEMLRRSSRYSVHMTKVDAEFYEVHERAIRRFLDHVDSTYGGVRGWALAQGIPGGTLDRIADMLRD